MVITYVVNPELKKEELTNLYGSVGWLHANKPNILEKAIKNSDRVVAAYSKDELIGLSRAISDQAITLYITDILVHPAYQRKGVGTTLLQILIEPYMGYQQILVSEPNAAGFYRTQKFILLDGSETASGSIAFMKPHTKLR